jgi:hypothetical protein
VIAAAGLGLLLGLHFDAWRPSDWPGTVAGVPGELVYRLAWMGLAYAYLAWFLRAVWRAERGEQAER